MSEMEIEKRLEELETKAMHQERIISDLSAQLFDHQKRIELLERFARDAGGKLKELASSAAEPMPGDVRPPHY
jgi:uncharacterized coiled-coil protein SlyX